MTDEDGMFIEDVLGDLDKRRRKVNSKKKGNRVELELTKILTERFGKNFSRSVGSGNRWGQVFNMPTHAKQTLTGDICPPEGYLWVIECKGGYEDKIDLNGFVENIAQLDAFIAQSTHDAKESGRKPIIMWKRSRKPWLTMLRLEDMGAFDYRLLLPVHLVYNGWLMVSLEKLLAATKDDFWFE
jgi:Holliday junction resolvase